MDTHADREQRLRNYLNQIIDLDPGRRRRGLQGMAKCILEVPASVRISFTASHLIGPLIDQLFDPAERCRNLALTLVASFVSECSSQNLERRGRQIISCTAARFGSHPFQEPVEELRLR